MYEYEKIISCWLYSLATQVFIEKPYLPIISKTDLMEKYGRGDLPMSLFQEMGDLSNFKMMLDQKGVPGEEDLSIDFGLCSYDRFRKTKGSINNSKTSLIFLKYGQILRKLVSIVERYGKIIFLNMYKVSIINTILFEFIFLKIRYLRIFDIKYK